MFGYCRVCEQISCICIIYKRSFAKNFSKKKVPKFFFEICDKKM